MLIPLCRRTEFDIYVPAAQTQTLILADRIDTVRYPAGQLIIRQYPLNGSAWGAGITVRFSARNMSIATDEPQTDFVYAGDMNSVDFLDTDSAPSMKYCVWSQNQAGSAIRVLMTILGGANGGQVKQAFGLDLLLRWP